MSILNHSPRIATDGLVLCLDAGAEQSWPSRSGGTDSNWGAEILVDGGFETWSSSTALTHWSKYIAGSSTVNRDSAEEESGTYCLRLDVDGSDSNTLVYSSVACFVPGRHYRVKFSAKCSSGTLNASVYESTTATVPDNGIPDTVLPLTTSYQSFVIDFTAHGNSGANQNLLFGRRSGGGGASKSIYFDNASVRELHWHDLSGNFNNGALINAPVFSAESGAGGTKSFDFDGTSDYIRCTKTPTFASDLTGAISIWAKADALGDSLVSFTKPSTGVVDEMRLGYYTNNKVQFVIYQNGVGDKGFTTDADAISLGQWHHITCVNDGSATHIYVDGVNVKSDADHYWWGDLTTDADTFTIGALERSSTLYLFNGKIATVHIYNQALTAAEVAQNYRTHKGRFGK